MINSIKCPCCGGETRLLDEDERNELIKEFGIAAGKADGEESSSNSDACPKGIVTGMRLTFNDGCARTRDYGWDGRVETMPREWMGRGHYVIASYHEVKSHDKHRTIVDGCVNRSYSRLVVVFATGEEGFSPVIYETIDVAREVMNALWNKVNEWGDARRVGTDVIERKIWPGEKYKKEYEIVPIEKYHPERRMDVLAAFKTESGLEEQKKTVAVSKRKPSARSVRTACAEEPRHGRIDDEERGSPIHSEIVQDWSKVDWEAEDRESDEMEKGLEEDGNVLWEAKHKIKEQLNDIRRAKCGIATVNATKKWLLQDWTTGKYVRVENGAAMLVAKKDCTYFERLGDANNVALTIERLFWKPQYASWRLHVEPYQSEKNR